MKPQTQTVFDPMFATRIARQQTPTYTRRPSMYVSSTRIAGSRLLTVQPHAVPVFADDEEPSIETTRQQTTSEPADVPLGESASEHTHGIKRFWHIPNRQIAVLYGMAGFVFVVGLLVSLNGVRTNRQVAAQVRHAQKQTEATVADNVTPSTTKPSPATIRNYAVSPNVPKYLDIPKLSIHTRILSEGLTKKGELQVPWNIYDTGWYNASSQPGQNGAMLVDGHSGIGKQHGVFYELNTLTTGDSITVTRGDGKKFTYLVTKVQTLSVGDVSMSDMLVSSDTSKPGLNLITCAGDIIPGTDELNKRVEVYAVMP